MKIFIINGLGGHGKDYFIKCLVARHLKIGNVSTIDPVKNSVIGLTNSKKNSVYRDVLHKIKTQMVRLGVIKNYIKDIVDANSYRTLDFLFIHSREWDEIKDLKEKYNAETIWVNREGYKSNEPKSVIEKMGNVKDYDFIVENGEKIMAEVNRFIKKYYNKVI